MRGVQHRFGPLHDSGWHIDDDIVKVRLCDFDNLFDILLPNHIERDQLTRSGQDVHPVIEVHQRLHEAVAVHRVGILKQLKDRFATWQIKIGRDRTKLQVEVDEADANIVVFFAFHLSQFPGHVNGKCC